MIGPSGIVTPRPPAVVPVQPVVPVPRTTARVVTGQRPSIGAKLVFRYPGGNRAAAAAVITEVFVGGIADGRLLVGDQVLRVNGLPIYSFDDYYAAAAAANGALEMHVLRAGQTHVVSLIPAANVPGVAPIGLGIYGIETPGDYLTVRAVEPNGAAAVLGVQPGYVIISVNNREILTRDDLRAAEALSGGRYVVKVLPVDQLGRQLAPITLSTP